MKGAVDPAQWSSAELVQYCGFSIEEELAGLNSLYPPNYFEWNQSTVCCNPALT